MPYLYDTHCHLFSEYNYDLKQVIYNFEKKNIKYVINNGTSYKTNKEVLLISKNYSQIKAAIGFHPEDLDKFQDEDLKQITDNIDKIVAIGEIGLDYYNSLVPKELQKEIFIKQLKIAQKYNKPVIIHSRNAYDDTLEILKKFNLKGSWHCFTGTIKEAKEIINMGYKLGIGGILTFKNSDLDEVIKNIDLKNIILETDSPYLSPVPYRGKTNEPKNIKIILEKIAEIKQMDEKEVAKIIEINTLELFKF